MTIQAAHHQLTVDVGHLWSAVGELALIVMEDQPGPNGLAAVDDLAEQVSELQGDVACAVALLDKGPDGFLTHFADTATHLDDARTRYWRRLRAHDTVDGLRSAVRRSGGGWSAWRQTVELSSRRCEEPLDAVTEALHTCWQEVCHGIAMTQNPAEPTLHSPSLPQRRTL